MVELTDAEWQRRGKPAFDRVFHNPDPFATPMSDTIERRAILYPVGYLLESNEYDAVCSAARAVGDEHLCLTVTEALGTDWDKPKHWLLGDDDFEAYEHVGYVGVLENALYSPAGKWGIIISHEQHAVAGGTSLFIDTLSGCFPSYASGISDFLEFWSSVRERGVDVSWLPALILHVYGGSRAEALLGDWGGAT